MTFDFTKLFRNISPKNIVYILGVMGIVLIFFASVTENDTKDAVICEEFDYCSNLEERLEKILPDIAAVGRVSVMITAKNYGSITLAKDMDSDREQTVVINKKGGGEDGLIVEEAYPKIQGVIIVAEGGRSDKVKAELTEAAVALLGVDAHRIKIFERTIK